MNIENINELIKKIQSLGVEVLSDVSEYEKDKTPSLTGKAFFTIVPRDADELSEALKILFAQKIPLFARGGGTGVTGGAVPFDGAVVSFAKMNRIIELDVNNMTITVEPGVITADINKAASEKKLFYPPDPASLNECTIGGNVSVSAGGPHAVKYGTTKDYVLGMEFVTVDGRKMHWGAKTVKNSAGFSLGQLIVGSEGTLAFVTKLILKLVPAPQYSCDILVSFSSIESAVSCVNKILLGRISPAALEFIDKSAASFVARHFPDDVYFPNAGALLLIRLDSMNTSDLEYQYGLLSEILKMNAEDFVRADDEATKEKIWNSRRKIRTSIEKESPVFFAEDPALPRAVIAEFIAKVNSSLREMNVGAVFFGHAGDGNIHINILKGGMDDIEWNKMKPEIRRMIYTYAIEMGGVITGEHGVGYTRKEYMKLMYSSDEMELMRNIKTAFDPYNLLNPGKIF
ncbi:MAG TPA: FAD-linked oxidase C-terminal domain-containing protein [Spirochaetota bacterium]|jgi:glycolate oxidase|nr:FAD-linked oxidase C-terminal domain-containing protein [Spirochaetota bacterium]HOH38056.1 FAD-linked oxidase C-terminal domain-containing protein [Spirochaetota bacterium]HPW51930.1 FAD-linked oxidase C-terminal domain-containing protein [Spirochaetota bacterium]